MDTVLGLLGIVAWILIVIGLASAITWAVVKLSPTKTERTDSSQS